MDNPHFIYIETYGCSANQNNSEIMKGIIRQAGLDIVENPNIADVCVVNTCIVKGPTEEKVKKRIIELADSKPVIVSGCMPEVRQKELKRIKNVYLLGINHVKDIAKMISKIYSAQPIKDIISEHKEIKLCLPKISQNKNIGITQISEGCSGDCAFCITKLAKGSLFSYPEEKILKSIQSDLDAGCREIWLTSQDNAAYDLDDGKRNLPKLLKKILVLKGNFKVRLGMMNPNNVLPILDELIEMYKHEKLYKFLHIPLQAGSNRILKLMSRQYRAEDFIKIVNKFRKEIPNITISTDVIVAYPSETENDFQKTLNIIKEIKPYILNISKFWPMKGTKAAETEKNLWISEKTAKQRAAEMMRLHLQICMENNKALVGKRLRCFVNEKGFRKEGRQTYLARDDNYQLIAISLSKNIEGRFVDVIIKDAKPHYLVGEVDER